ncbi:Protein FAM3C [Liparis tanakae]|uniref:Protein FAM3C n=1 Tax=Liparis tanakae TaxID=230148 RepID=A0A4Z2J4I8_9TELE|nr:Protein FAM3C [Liparis tanakae]
MTPEHEVPSKQTISQPADLVLVLPSLPASQPPFPAAGSSSMVLVLAPSGDRWQLRQGGAVVEIFSGQGKDPVAKWKLYGGPSAIHKWSTLCIDLESFTGELFKGFLTLDGITLFATCKVRRIFTMKAEPAGMSNDDVTHVTQVLNMDHLRKADMRPGLLSSDCVRPTQLGLCRLDEPGSPSRRMDQSESLAKLRENLSHALSSDLQVWSSWESNEGPEPQLTLQGEVFTFASQPHSPKPGQGQGNQEMTGMGDDQLRDQNVRRYEAQLEDDFIGSESDEDKSCNTFNAVTPRSPSPIVNVQGEVHSESHNIDQITPKELNPATAAMPSPSSARAEPAGIAPTRCLSPSATPRRQEVKCGTCGSEVVNQVVDENSSVPLSRRLLQEVKLDDSPQHTVIVLKAEENNTLTPVDCGDYNLHKLSRLRMHGDDDHELRMLASLKREQEADECGASGLSASQIHHCNVSVSMSSDDASTWTHVSTSYEKESIIDEAMANFCKAGAWSGWTYSVLPLCLRASGEGREESVKDEEKEDEYLNLLYDPCLNCYFDPKTGKLHPGVIASVIFVSVAAIFAALLIIRRYCFPVNEAGYRYSQLRWMEDQGSAVTEAEGDRGPGTVGEESDEVKAQTELLLKDQQSRTTLTGPKCSLTRICPSDHFALQIISGAANVIGPKICFDDAEYILAYLKEIQPGMIVLVASFDDVTPKMTDDMREVFVGMGSTLIKSVKPRDSWVFAGKAGTENRSLFEKQAVNDEETNIYEGWPEIVEMAGCIPKDPN